MIFSKTVIAVPISSCTLLWELTSIKDRKKNRRKNGNMPPMTQQSPVLREATKCQKKVVLCIALFLFCAFCEEFLLIMDY